MRRARIATCRSLFERAVRMADERGVYKKPSMESIAILGFLCLSGLDRESPSLSVTWSSQLASHVHFS
jgi:hypothetical protein